MAPETPSVRLWNQKKKIEATLLVVASLLEPIVFLYPVGDKDEFRLDSKTNIGNLETLLQDGPLVLRTIFHGCLRAQSVRRLRCELKK